MTTEASRSVGSSAEEQNREFQQQVQTYIAWVNSQLKKRSGNKPVSDLKTDFNDGVILATLVEIISGEKLEGVSIPASSFDDKARNINAVLKFILSKNIRMHHITENDVIDGNIKSIMRLILTLAAHFKPSSVGMKKSVSAAAANANVALGDIHKRVTSSGGFRSRWKSSTPASLEGRRYLQNSSGTTRSVSQMSERSETDSYTMHKLSSSSDVFASPTLRERSKSRRNDIAASPISNLSSINNEIVLGSGSGTNENASEQISEYYDDLESDISSTRDLISVLQNLLLNGEIQDGISDHEQCLPIESSSPNEERVILMSRLDLCQHENSRLKIELADVRQECRTASASKTVLNSRTQHQDKELLALKQEILKLNLMNDKLRKEKEYATAQVEEYRREKQAFSNEITEKNMTIKHLKDELGIVSTQLKRIGDDSKLKLNSMQKLENQVQELSHQLRILQRYKQGTGSKPTGNESTVISESLHSLRSNLPLHDSRQHILDTLEQAVISLAESDHRNDTPIHRNSDISRHSATHSPRSRKKDIAHKGASTTVIYFTERNMTPVRASIYKRIGDITLRDFKDVLQYSGNYKFNFKALDPEFGTVKKEIFHDDDIVPGWEGKIVAWLEKEE